MSDTTTTPESEGSGDPINPTAPPNRSGPGAFAVEPMIVPPPLNQTQVDKIVAAVEAVGQAAKAVGEAIQALGSLYGDYCKWVFRRVKPLLIPPLVPPGTQEPSTPPSTTP